ncbi:MAG TPA: hypothetical protein VFP14_02105 [Novosphingobium sp.]|jgi:hypothetical protein|nr:hypothetical protein [Novosphingobium sp.]
MSQFRFAALALALVAPATAGMADTVQVSAASVTPKAGEVLRDNAGRRIGAVDSVRADKGYLTVIVDMTIVRIPLASLSRGDKGLQTSLSRSALR